MKQIQEWLGHSTYVTTADIYSHLDFSSKVNVGKAIGDFFGAVQEPEKKAPYKIIDALEIDPEYNSSFIYTTSEKPEIISERPLPEEKPIIDEQASEQEEASDDDEISYEEYQEFKRWKRMMKKKDMEM